MIFLLKIVLATIVIFFVWNILRRIFLSSNTPAAPTEKDHKKDSAKIHWDAETVDYEEIPTDKNKKP